MISCISAGAHINDAAEDGATALCLSAECGDTKCCSILLEAGANMNAKTTDQQTAMHLACANEHYDTAAFLLENSHELPADVVKYMQVKVPPLKIILDVSRI